MQRRPVRLLSRSPLLVLVGVALLTAGCHPVGTRLVAWDLSASDPYYFDVIWDGPQPWYRYQDVVDVDAGPELLVLLRRTGTVEVYDPWSDRRFTPPGLTDVVQVAAGGGPVIDYDEETLFRKILSHLVAVRSDGTVVAWGNQRFGQGSVPSGLRNVRAVSAGPFHNLALKRNGTVRSWGHYWDGEPTSTPVPATFVPDGLENVVEVSAGSMQSAALKRNGRVVAWNTGRIAVPSAFSELRAIADGGSIGLRRDGTVLGWDGTVQAGLRDVVAIDASPRLGIALRENGTVVSWFLESGERLKTPPGLRDVLDVASSGVPEPALRRTAHLLLRTLKLADPPLGVRTDAEVRALRVFWAPPSDDGGAMVDRYRAIATPGRGSCTTRARGRPPEAAWACTISDLSSTTSYTVTVTAHTDAGWGHPSAPSDPVRPRRGG